MLNRIPFPAAPSLQRNSQPAAFLAGDKSGLEVLNRNGFPLPCRFYRLLNCKLGLLGESHCTELVILTNNRSLSLDSS